MHARVSTYALDDGTALQHLNAFTDALGEIAALDGFEDGYLLVGDDGGAALTVTVWRDQTSLEASRVRASSLRTGAARALGASVTSTVELRVAARLPRPPEA